jgi:hypothetical protein
MPKFYCIEPATKDKDGVCVLPTMQEPELGYATVKPVIEQYHKDLEEWEKHLESLLPKFPTSCDRAGWFEGREQYQENFFQENGKDRVWRDCDKWEYNMTSDEYRRKFIVPQSEEKDLASIPNEEDKQKEQKDEPKDGFRNYLAKALAPKVEPQPAPKEEGKIGYWIFKGDEINSFLVAILRQLSTEQMTVLRDALNERTPNKLRTESEVREIVGRTWEAAERWEIYRNTPKINPHPDKETFINGLF